MRISLPALTGLLLACSQTPTSAPSGDLGVIDADGGAYRTQSAIRHVVVLVEENHTFDAYFGRYCTGAAGVSCNDGPSCCEAAPATQPAPIGTTGPELLNAASNYKTDRNHETECELAEMNWDGQRYLMDRYVTGAGLRCSSFSNYALVDPKAGSDDTGVSSTYWDYARRYALADRYFQPVVGSTSSNDMFLATAQFHFADNQVFPVALGTDCQLSAYSYLPPPIQDKPKATVFTNTTIADLLIQQIPGRPFAHYHQGFRAIHDAQAQRTLDRDSCPPLPADCKDIAARLNAAPCSYDPSDNPFRYFAQFAEGSDYAQRYLRDLDDFATDVQAGRLPAVAFVKGLTYVNEHPNWSHIYEGVGLVDRAIKQVLDPARGEMIDGRFVAYADSTLILLTWDEGGGFFDHVAPPRQAPVDGRPYGTRVPLLAIGKFARRGYVSHVQLEHSSIVKFIEWNFLGGRSGQLATLNKPTSYGTAQDLPRDAAVNNLGDLLDPAQTGTVVPSGQKD